MTLEERKRFESKIKKGEAEECWLWQAGKINGYGCFYLRGRSWRASQISADLWKGKAPEGLFVCHRCDNRLCCNPSHLFFGTHQNNMSDMAAKGRAPRGDDHPSRKHPENLSRGDNHFSRRHPEKLPRGDDHYSRRDPSRLSRGENHYTNKHPEKRLRGAANGSAKLAEQDVFRIREMKGSMSSREIAEMFGVTKSAVKAIQARRTWAHI